MRIIVDKQDVIAAIAQYVRCTISAVELVNEVPDIVAYAPAPTIPDTGRPRSGKRRPPSQQQPPQPDNA